MERDLATRPTRIPLPRQPGSSSPPLPLFHFDVVLYTFVLTGVHDGEIWRYEISPHAWDSVRAATSLAALFDQWTRGIAAGVVGYDEPNKRLLVEDVDQVPGLDPLAFPVAPVEETLLHARQRECGVNMAIVEEGFEYHEECARLRR